MKILVLQVKQRDYKIVKKDSKELCGTQGASKGQEKKIIHIVWSIRNSL